MNQSLASLSYLSLLLFAFLGLALVGLSLLAMAHRRSRPSGQGLHKDLDRLIADIVRGLRILSSPARAGGMFYREKQEEVGRLLSDLQGRLRHLDDGLRQAYEARASRVLADAARAGITLPPLETPMISTFSHRF